MHKVDLETTMLFGKTIQFRLPGAKNVTEISLPLSSLKKGLDNLGDVGFEARTVTARDCPVKLGVGQCPTGQSLFPFSLHLRYFSSCQSWLPELPFPKVVWLCKNTFGASANRGFSAGMAMSAQ